MTFNTFNSKDPEIPSFIRMPKRGTKEHVVFVLNRVQGKINKLRNLGLTPHPNLIDHKLKLESLIENNGPYEIQP